MVFVGLRCTALGVGPALGITAPDDAVGGYGFTVEFDAAAINDLYGTSVEMVFDPDAVQIDDVILADVFGGETLSTLVSDIDNEAGTMSYAWSLTGEISGADIGAETTLITVECTAINETDTTWDIDVTNSASAALTVGGDNTRILLLDSDAQSITFNEPTHSIAMDKGYADEIVDEKLVRTYYDSEGVTVKVVEYYGSDDTSVIYKINCYTDGVRTSYRFFDESGDLQNLVVLHPGGAIKKVNYYDTETGIRFQYKLYDVQGRMTHFITTYPDGIKPEKANYYNVESGLRYRYKLYDTQGRTTHLIETHPDGIEPQKTNYYDVLSGIRTHYKLYDTLGRVTHHAECYGDGIKAEQMNYFNVETGILSAYKLYRENGSCSCHVICDSEGEPIKAIYYDEDGNIVDIEWFVGPNPDTLVDFALTQLGKPYVLGGKGPDTFDCSGFVYYCLNSVGFDIRYMTSTTWRSADFTTIYDMNDIQKGDILCLYGHVGIYMGDGMVVDASSSQGMIVTRTNIFRSSYWTGNFVCAKRVF